MKLLILSAMILAATLSRSCEPDIDQGLAGEVLWLEGNLMPTISENPEQDSGQAQGEPIRRELHIYELTTMDQAEMEGTFFHNIQTKLVKTTKSDKNGLFQIALPAGSYSVFVREDQGLFASTFDGQGNINPVEVKEGEVSKITIKVNYKAAY